MRKHFLILMLMALLPFTAWAAGPQKKVSLTYDGDAQLLVDNGTEEGKTYYYAVVVKDATAPSLSSYQAFDDAQNLWPSATNAGDYDVYWIATDGDAPESVEGATKISAVNIAKIELSVTLVGGNMEYTGAVPTVAKFYTITAGGDDIVDGETPIIVTGAATTAVNVSPTAYAFELAADPNYDVTFSATAGTLTITKKALTVNADNVDITYGETPVYTYTYTGLVATDKDGENQPKPGVVAVSAPTVTKDAVAYAGNAGSYNIAPNITAANYTVTANPGTLTVAQKALNGNEDIVITTPTGYTYTGAANTTMTATVKDNGAAIAAAQYDITYTYSVNGVVDYAPAASLKDAGFYKQVVTAKNTGNYSGSITSDAFQIEKADLLVQAKDKEIIYTGVAHVFGATDIIYEGFLGDDEATTGNEHSAFTALPTITTTDVNVKAGGYKIIPANGVSKNYNLLYTKGTLTINAAKLQITAVDKPVNYGASTAYNYPAGSIKSSEVGDYIKLKVQGADGNYGDYITASNTIKTYLAETGSTTKYIQGLAISRAAGDNVNTNPGYVITASGASPVSSNYVIDEYVNGKYTISATTFTFAVDNLSKKYGEDDPTLTYSINEVISTDDEAAIREHVTLTRVAGETVGTYTISLVDDGFEHPNFALTTTATGKLFIRKADLTVTVADQTLYTGNKLADLNKTEDSAYTITGLQNKTVNGVTLNDAAEVKFAFAAGVGISDIEGHEGELTAGGPYNAGIELTITNYDDLFANYNLDDTYTAKLTVIDVNTAITLKATANNTDAIATTAAVAGKKQVTLSGRTLTANQWNVLVLPFEISTYDFINDLGCYAVFNTLSSAVGADVKFSLELTKLEANVPFLVKPQTTKTADIVFNGADDLGVTVVNATPTKTIGSATFVGTYAPIDPLAVQDGMYTPQGGKFLPYTSQSTYAFPATMAYLLVDSSTPARITVEELDGSVTAISTINAEGVAMPAEGWYTVNGVKLEGAPTEKGIYINNGKKVVIK